MPVKSLGLGGWGLLACALASCALDSETQDAPTEKGVVAARPQALLPSPDTSCTSADFNNKKYFFCTNDRSWATAESKCLGVDGTNFHLASIETSSENEFIRTHIAVDSWVSGTDASTEGTWLWQTSQQFWLGSSNGTSNGQYANWASGQPNNLSNQDCLLIDDNSPGKWNDESCSSTRDYVCEGDGCPLTSKTDPGQCGCDVPDTDSDNDGTANCNDGCPNDQAKTAPGICGCGVSDADADGDGALTCQDECPNDSRKVVAGDCGCAGAGAADEGTACDDGLCAANDECDGNGMCGTASQCGVPDSDCDFRMRAGVAYWFCDNDRLFDEARERCQNAGMDIATVEDEGEDDFITDNISEHSFLGATDSVTEGEWFWLPPNGTQFWSGGEGGDPVGSLYTNWDNGEPENDGNRDCLAKDSFGAGEWETHPCSFHDAYVCETPDLCPQDSRKVRPGACGCSVSDDVDTDNDTTPDCIDFCPLDPEKTMPFPCKCGVPDTDSDDDGTPDCNEDCDNDPLNTSAAACGCNGESNELPAGTACRLSPCPQSDSDPPVCNADATCGNDDCDPEPNGSSWHRSDDPSSCAIYWTSTTARTWLDADQKCRSIGGRWLADLGSAAEALEVQRQIAAAGITVPVWVGGNDRGLDGEWRWPQWDSNDGVQFWSGSTSGQPVDRQYTAWAASMPSSGDCVALNPDGTWSSASCTLTKPYVCRAFDHACLGPPDTRFANPLADGPDFQPQVDHEPANCVDPLTGTLANYPVPDPLNLGPSDVCSPDPTTGNLSQCNAAPANLNDIDDLESDLAQDAEANGTTGAGWGNCVADPSFVDLDHCGLQTEIDTPTGPFVLPYEDKCGDHSTCQFFAPSYLARLPYTHLPADLVNPTFVCVPVSPNDCVIPSDCDTTEIPIPTSDPNGAVAYLPEKRCHLAAFEEVEAHTLTDGTGPLTTDAHSRTSCLPDPVTPPGAGGPACRFVDLCNPPGADGDSQPAPSSKLTPIERATPPWTIGIGIQDDPSPTYTAQEAFCPDAPQEGVDDECYCDYVTNDIDDISEAADQHGDDAGGSSVWDIDFTPNLSYTANLDPLPLGESEFRIGAKGSLDVNASVFGVGFSVLHASAELAVERCGLEWTPELTILAPPLGSLGIGEIFLDQLDVPDPIDSLDGAGPTTLQGASLFCKAALDYFKQVGNETLKSYRDAQTIVTHYRTLLAAGKQLDRETFCHEVAHIHEVPSTPRFAALDCQPDKPETPLVNEAEGNPLPQDVVNAFVDNYHDQLATLKSVAGPVLVLATQNLTDVQDAATGISFSGRFPAPPDRRYGDAFGDTVVEFPFAIGPIPMVFALDVFASYGITNPVFQYELTPLTAATTLARCTASPLLCAFGNQTAQLGQAAVSFGPGAGAGASLFLGAGFGINGFSIALGVNGDLTLIEVTVPMTAGASLDMLVEPDVRPVPTAVAALSATPASPDVAAQAALPRIRTRASLAYHIGGKIKLDNILHGTVSARLRLKLNLLFATLSFEYKQRLFDFDGFSAEYPLFDISDSVGADLATLPGFEGEPLGPADSEGLGVFETHVPFVTLARVPVPPIDPVTGNIDAGFTVRDALPSGFAPPPALNLDAVYGTLPTEASQDLFTGLHYARSCDNCRPTGTCDEPEDCCAPSECIIPQGMQTGECKFIVQ